MSYGPLQRPAGRQQEKSIGQDAERWIFDFQKDEPLRTEEI